ncbi:MAG: Gfo/Idh/MocA family oxidoreductase [Acidobacteriota bacterium]
MTEQLNQLPGIAVVGAGYWGVNHVRNFYQLGALQTVCDANIASLQKISETFPDVNIETDFEKVLADSAIQGVVIATPAESHFRLASRALKAGKHLLVEKPLTLNVEEGEQLVALAGEQQRVLMVGHLLEFHPAVLRLREFIESGELGELHYIYSNRLNLGKIRREENILWSFAPHDIAIILRLVGELPSRVSATGGAYLQPQIADVTVTNMEFPHGTRAQIFVSWLHPYKEQRMVIVGSKKMAVFDDVRKENKLMTYEHVIEFVEGEPVMKKGEGIPVELESAEPLKRECQHFLECIQTGKQPLTDGESGVRVLRILEAAEQSLEQQGAPVAL